MNYDNDVGKKHATYESVYGENGSISQWTKFGIPKTKIVTGVPFYARAGWGEEWLFYKDIVKMKPEISFDIDFISYVRINHFHYPYLTNWLLDKKYLKNIKHKTMFYDKKKARKVCA